MCYILACCGNCGSYSLHYLEDFILAPFVNPTLIGGTCLLPLVLVSPGLSNVRMSLCLLLPCLCLVGVG